MTDRMLDALRRNWWTLVVRGGIAVLFGVFAWFWPRLTFLALLLTWGAVACVSGVGTLASAFARDGNEPRWILLLEGVITLGAGLMALFYPRVTALVFVYLLAVWALMSGVLQCIGAYRLRAEVRGEFWLGFAGVLSLLFGVMLLLRPGAGALGLVWLIASFSVLYGIALIAWGVRLKGLSAVNGRERLEDRSGAVSDNS